MTFFSHRPHILNFPPIFPVISTFPSCFAKIIIFPYFYKFHPPVIDKFTSFFYILYVYFVPPYFDHDAFMHHPMHVLDALGGKGLAQGPYVTARAGVEPTTLRLKVIASTKAPLRPTIAPNS